MRDNNKILTIAIMAAAILLFGVLIVVKNLPEDSTNTADNSVASAESVTDMPTDQPTEVPAEETVTPTESQTDEDETASTESATEESSPEATESVDTAEKATEEPAAVATEAPMEAATEVPTEVPADIPTEVATEAPTEAPAQTPVAAVYTFRNQKLLDQHYEKHGIEMGFPSAAAYEAAASAVITNPAALHKQEQEDGDFVYYVEATNEFVVLSTDGYIRTYFLPDRGKAYYDKQ